MAHPTPQSRARPVDPSQLLNGRRILSTISVTENWYGEAGGAGCAHAAQMSSSMLLQKPTCGAPKASCSQEKSPRYNPVNWAVLEDEVEQEEIDSESVDDEPGLVDRRGARWGV